MTKPRPYKHPQINLRIPQELKDSIESVALASGRSMNAEIVYRLEQSLNQGMDAGDEVSHQKTVNEPVPLSDLSKDIQEVKRKIGEISKAIEKLNKE